MTKLPFLSILTAAAEACARQFPGRTVGILATRGTLAAGLYQQALAVQGVEYLVPDEAEQDALMRVIYDGVKAGRGPEVYGPVFRTVTEGMAARGAEVFLLGCTELPMAAAGEAASHTNTTQITDRITDIKENFFLPLIGVTPCIR